MPNSENKLDIFEQLPEGYDPIGFVGHVVESANGNKLRRLIVAKEGVECIDENGERVKVVKEIFVRHTR